MIKLTKRKEKGHQLKVSLINNYNYRKNNPNFGKLVGLESLPENCKKAIENNKEFEKLSKKWEADGKDVHLHYFKFLDFITIANGKDINYPLVGMSDFPVEEKLKVFTLDGMYQKLDEVRNKIKLEQEKREAQELLQTKNLTKKEKTFSQKIKAFFQGKMKDLAENE